METKYILLDEVVGEIVESINQHQIIEERKERNKLYKERNYNIVYSNEYVFVDESRKYRIVACYIIEREYFKDYILSKSVGNYLRILQERK